LDVDETVYAESSGASVSLVVVVVVFVDVDSEVAILLLLVARLDVGSSEEPSLPVFDRLDRLEGSCREIYSFTCLLSIGREGLLKADFLGAGISLWGVCMRSPSAL
jgi:hypothetical protein